VDQSRLNGIPLNKLLTTLKTTTTPQTSLEQKHALGEMVAKSETIDLLISNAQTLEMQLESQSYKDPLSLESALSLITLNQQASGQIENLQVQLSAETISNTETTVGVARESLTALISALEQQKEELTKTVSDKSDKITFLAARYESVRYEVDQLTLQRDLNRQAYDALSTHIVEVQILSANNDEVAKVAGEALPPATPSSPKTLFITAIAGLLGIVISTVFVLGWDWWKSPKVNE
jgi:LPS O-antigen subunit length determinant protein (WzzB/FepE family)